MPGEARHHDEQRRVLVLGQAEPLLERQLVSGLTLAHGLYAVMLGQIRVLFRVEQRHIDAVDDAGERLAARGKNLGQAVRVVGVTQLFGVGLRDGAHAVSHDDAGLEEVLAVVEAENFVALRRRAKHVAVKVEAAFALIFDVVDGEDAPCVGEVAAVLHV